MQVILDWLYSELVAVPFILRFLKVLIEQQNDVHGQQYSSFSCLPYVPYNFLKTILGLIAVASCY